MPASVGVISLVGVVGPSHVTFLLRILHVRIMGDETGSRSLYSLKSVCVALNVGVPDNTPIFNFINSEQELRDKHFSCMVLGILRNQSFVITASRPWAV